MKVEDLRIYSRALVDVKCDYCGTVKTIEFQAYNQCMKAGDKYACKECAMLKHEEIMKKKYGVENPFMLPEVKKKIVKTNLNKFGVEYHTQTEEFKQRYLYSDKNHFYIDGRHEFTEDRNTWRYKRWRRTVLERDKNQCVICGSTEKLTVHHKNSYIKYKKDRFNVGNGITLCESCHMDFHGAYGYRDNTYIQYEEWLAKTLNDYPIVGVE